MEYLRWKSPKKWSNLHRWILNYFKKIYQIGESFLRKWKNSRENAQVWSWGRLISLLLIYSTVKTWCTAEPPYSWEQEHGVAEGIFNKVIKALMRMAHFPWTSSITECLSLTPHSIMEMALSEYWFSHRALDSKLGKKITGSDSWLVN